jgi:hypothetical protein
MQKATYLNAKKIGRRLIMGRAIRKRFKKESTMNWVVTPCTVIEFYQTYFIHLQSPNVSKASNTEEGRSKQCFLSVA